LQRRGCEILNAAYYKKISIAVVMALNTSAFALYTHCVTLLVSAVRNGSVGTALGYGLDDRGSRFRFPAGAGNFSLHHHVQNGSRAHSASYPMGTRGSFPGGKAAGS
jgi:hypothetical protein